MNREIKFRAWDKKENKMFEVSEIIFHGVKGMDINEKNTLGMDLWHISENTELMQFTGLKDKNGKEIYEGDINKNDDERKSEVVFYAGGFYLKFSETEYKAIGSFAPFNWLVIGNIYENPNLLK